MIFEPIRHLVETMHLSCMINTISKRIETSFYLHHVGVQSGAPKVISEPMVRLAQTVHLSCVEINTVSKWTEMSFHLAHVS
jgi:hypothetical protein